MQCGRAYHLAELDAESNWSCVARALTMDEPVAPNRQHLDQVLELSIDYIYDTAALVRVALASSVQHNQVVGHVQQHLPRLLKHQLAAHLQLRSVSAAMQTFEWLLSTAGPAIVGTPAVADALLCPVPGPFEGVLYNLPDLAVKHGLQLSVSQLAAAAKQRVKGLDAWLKAASHATQPAAHKAGSSSSSSSIPAHISQLAYPSDKYTLPKTVSTAELRDMLLIAVNMPHPEPAEAILLFDKQQHKQLLYASGSNTSNSTSSSGGSSSSSSGSSTAQLVEQLITTAVIRRHWRLAPLLAATPAAQQLGLPALTQLLSVCIHLERVPVQHPGLPAGYFYFPVQPAAQDTVAPCLQLLCALPAAAGMTPSTAASLMRLAVKQQQYKLAERLVALPAAQQLAAPQLFELLLLLLPQNTARLRQHTQRNSLVERLTALPSGKQLAPSAARQLFSMVLEQRPSELSLAMLQLQSLGQEGQLTSSDVLQLLQQAAKQGCGDAIAGIATLAAAQQIDDVDGFAAFLQTALAHGIGESIMTEAVVRLPVLQQLGPHAVLGILQSGLKAFRLDPSRSHPRSAYRFIVEHPAVSSFSTETLGQLLLEAGQQRCLVDTVHQTHDSVHRASTLRFYGMAALLKAPAAVGLPVATVASLLQHAAQERVRHRIQEGEPWQHSDEEDDSCCDQPFALDAMQPFLVALPAAQQLDADAIVRVLTAAVTANNAAGVRSVCPLPGTQQVSAEAALELLQQAAAQGCKLWLAVRSALPQLAALPAGQLQLTSQQLYSFLQEAVTTADSRSVGSLCKLVGEAGDAEAALFSISSDAMQQLLATAVTFYSPSHRAVHAAEQLVALAAARALGPDAVAALLESCVKRYNAAGVTLVGQLPAASQLSQQVAEKLLLQCLLGRHQIDSTGYAQCANAGPTVCALVQLPAVQRLAADAVTRVLLAGITERMQDEWWVLSRLPLAKHGALSRGAVRQLLQAAYEVQQWDMFDWLVELPAAPRHDDEEEVAILRAVRACQSAQ